MLAYGDKRFTDSDLRWNTPTHARKRSLFATCMLFIRLLMTVVDSSGLNTRKVCIKVVFF